VTIRRKLSAPQPSVAVMTDTQTAAAPPTEEYWARVQQLRDELVRLRPGSVRPCPTTR